MVALPVPSTLQSLCPLPSTKKGLASENLPSVRLISALAFHYNDLKTKNSGRSHFQTSLTSMLKKIYELLFFYSKHTLMFKCVYYQFNQKQFIDVINVVVILNLYYQLTVCFVFILKLYIIFRDHVAWQYCPSYQNVLIDSPPVDA